ncbi:MAG TPA: AtpZ/AtpI family protein [Ktedonobacteraceae bacterium]|nr:AtpZ/AtpI family protein [Ktedonobacteraceae bacterium]
MKQRPQAPIGQTVGVLSGMGFTIAVPIVAGAVGGHFLDGLTHTEPLFLLLGLLLGLIAGMYGAYRLLKQFILK